MKTKNIDAAEAWKQFEDFLAPGLNFSVYDRALYSHLFRHSHLEGKQTFQFALGWLGHCLGISRSSARNALRHLLTQGAVQLLTRICHAHHIVRVNLPSELRAVRAAKTAAARKGPGGYTFALKEKATV